MATTLELETLVVRLTADATAYLNILAKAQGSTKAFSSSVQQSLRRVELAFKSVSNTLAAPILGVGTSATEAFGEFDLRMTESTSVMENVTGEMRKDMEDLAKSLSMTGKQSAAELAQGFYFLASAGQSTADALGSLPVVQNFATAGNFDLAKATSLATDAQAALGMTVRNNNDPIQESAQNLANLTRITDVLIKADSIANASAQQFSTALTHQAGAAARAFGKDLEETVAVLAAFASQGIKAELAGNTFSRLLRVLSYSAIKHADAYKALNIQVYDANGTMRNTADIIQNLEQVLEPMSDELRTATLKALGFEIRLQQAVLPLLGTSEAIREFETRLRKAGGTAQEVAQKQMQAFNNQMLMVKNTVNVLAIEVGRTMAPALETLSYLLQETVLWVQNLDPKVKEAVTTFLAMAAGLTVLTAIVATAGAAFAFLAGSVGWIAGPLIIGILSAAAAFSAWVEEVGGITAAFAVMELKLAELWDWLLPVRRAMNGIISTSWGTLKVVFNDLVRLTKEWWGALTGGQLSWDQLQAKVVDGLIYLEFGISRFKDVFKLAWLSIQMYALQAVNWVLDKWGEFVNGGWAEVNSTIAQVWAKAWTAMMKFAISSLVAFMQRAQKLQLLFVAGFFSEKARDLLSKELNDFAADAMKALPKALQIDLPKLDLNKLRQQLKDAEATIREEWDKLKGTLGEDFATFRDRRLKEINAQVAEAVAKGENPVEALFGNKVRVTSWGKGREVAEGVNAGIKSALQPIENVLFGSAEAARRIDAFRDSILPEDQGGGIAWGEGRGIGKRKKEVVPRAVPLDGAQAMGRADNVEKLLADIKDILAGESKKPDVKVRPANLNA